MRSSLPLWGLIARRNSSWGFSTTRRSTGAWCRGSTGGRRRSSMSSSGHRSTCRTCARTCLGCTGRSATPTSRCPTSGRVAHAPTCNSVPPTRKDPELPANSGGRPRHLWLVSVDLHRPVGGTRRDGRPRRPGGPDDVSRRALSAHLRRDVGAAHSTRSDRDRTLSRRGIRRSPSSVGPQRPSRSPQPPGDARRRPSPSPGRERGRRH